MQLSAGNVFQYFLKVLKLGDELALGNILKNMKPAPQVVLRIKGH
jgi:hypothetical protein